LCVVVIVVVCSWGLSLLFSFTCWNSYKRSQPNHLYCTQCSTLQPPYQHQQHYPDPPPHTAERLGILESGEQQPAVPAPPVLQSSHGSYSVFPRTGYGAGLEVLDTVPDPSHRREELDHDTTISRSFRSARKRSSGIERSLSRSTGIRNDGKVPQVTLNERFSTLSNPPAFLNPEDTTASAKSRSSAKSKLSQVRIPTSPPPSEQDQALARTPSKVMKSTRKSIQSNSSRRSLWGARKEKLSNSSHVLTSKSKGGTRKKANTKDNGHEALTSETNLETSDDDVFISQKTRTGEQLGEHYTTPVNPELVQRQVSQEGMLAHRDRSNPRKERQVGSPGNTATADYFIKQHTPQLLNIDLDRPGEQCKSAMVARVNTQARRKVSSSAPARQAGGGKALALAQGHKHHFLSAKSRQAYKPGYSESDLASQSEDETRRQNWGRRGALELPPTQGPTPGFDLTPPVLDLSQVLPDPPSDPLGATSTLSTNPSPLQYSSVSFSQSDMSLVVSPAMPPTQYASSHSSHPVSLDWDNYASDPQFHHHSFNGNGVV